MTSITVAIQMIAAKVWKIGAKTSHEAMMSKCDSQPVFELHSLDNGKQLWSKESISSKGVARNV